MLSEYRESRIGKLQTHILLIIDFIYIDYDNMCFNRVNKEKPIEEFWDCVICLSRTAKAKQIEKADLEAHNLRIQAHEYCNLGMHLLNVKYEINENYTMMTDVDLSTYENLPLDILHEIFGKHFLALNHEIAIIEMKQIYNLRFINKVSKSVFSIEELSTYKIEDKTELKSEDLIWYLKSLITEVRYFTFGNEKKSKNISVLHKILSERHIGKIYITSH